MYESHLPHFLTLRETKIAVKIAGNVNRKGILTYIVALRHKSLMVNHKEDVGLDYAVLVYLIKHSNNGFTISFEDPSYSKKMAKDPVGTLRIN